MTKGHDAFVNRTNGRVNFYAHHLPGCGLLLGAVFAVFLGAGLGYLEVFNWCAWQHHHWQFPLLPAVVIALSLAVTAVAGKARGGPRRVAFRVLLGLIILEVITASTVGLYKRHTTPEDRVIQAVEKLQSRYL